MGIAHISNGTELVGLLLKGWEIEKQFEGVSSDESNRYAICDKVRRLMPQLISESGEHLSLVESMIARVNTDCAKWDYAQHVSKFPFHLSWDAEMIREIARVERRAMDAYANILRRLNDSDSSAFLSPEDREFVLETLERLVHDENEHSILAASALEPQRH